MICPRCETPSLLELDRQGITVDRCDRCRGIWLDRGELEKLLARQAAEAPPGVERSAAPRHDERGAAAYPDAPRRYRRPDSDHDDDDYRGGKRRSWWEIFD